VLRALALYLIASQVAAAIIQLIAFLTHATWVAVVLIAYAVVAGTIGTLLTRSRDIG